MEEHLTDVKSLKARQEDLTAQRQEVTQKLTAALERLKEAGMQFRALVRAEARASERAARSVRRGAVAEAFSWEGGRGGETGEREAGRNRLPVRQACRLVP